jgi:hypothetical protein|eukprot:COSAG06_NODE_6870_length_2735_cov_5.929818_3_plen_56_part_00
MLTRGLSKRDVQRLLVDNPRTILTFAKPQKLLPGMRSSPRAALRLTAADAPAPKL